MHNVSYIWRLTCNLYRVLPYRIDFGALVDTPRIQGISQNDFWGMPHAVCMVLLNSWRMYAAFCILAKFIFQIWMDVCSGITTLGLRSPSIKPDLAPPLPRTPSPVLYISLRVCAATSSRDSKESMRASRHPIAFDHAPQPILTLNGKRDKDKSSASSVTVSNLVSIVCNWWEPSLLFSELPFCLWASVLCMRNRKVYWQC